VNRLIPTLCLALAPSLSLACPLTPEVERAAGAAARAAGLEPQLLLALLWQESRYCHRGPDGALTTSPAGALGIAQLMPATAEALGVDPRDLEDNVHGAARYLRMQWDRFQDWPLALAAYNAGPGAVERWGGVPPYPETQRYVESVLGAYLPGAEGAPTPRSVPAPTASEPPPGTPAAIVLRKEQQRASAVLYRR
jgi:soluble lytic murein transglycosylase-like protein